MPTIRVTGPRIRLSDVNAIFEKVNIPIERSKSLLETLLWFGFLGVVVGKDVVGRDAYYAYTVHYDMKKLRKLAGDFLHPGTEMEPTGPSGHFSRSPQTEGEPHWPMPAAR